jgi:hypothetical protein
MNRKLPLLVGAGALAIVLAVPVLTHAQTGTPAQPAPENQAQPGPMWKMHGGWGRMGMGMGMRGGGMSLLQATVDVTGLTAQEVIKEKQAGKSFAQIAESKGKTGNDVVAAARTALTKQLDETVKAGNLTQEWADARLKAFDAMAAVAVKDTTVGPKMNMMEGRGFGHGRHGDCPGMQKDAQPGASTPGMWFQRLRGGNGA